MYNIKCDKKFKSKLNIPNFGIRYRKLIENNKKKKVIYLKEEFDNSTFRYRYYNFEEALRDSKKYSIICFLSSEIPQIINNINDIDLLVLQRTTWCNDIGNIIEICKINSIPVVYDIDDLIYKYDYIPDYLNNIGESDSINTVRFYMGVAAGLEMVAKQCDYFISTTSFLDKYLKKDFQKESFIIPNFYNNEQAMESEEIINKRKYNNKKFVIGYFSGSPSHLNDLRVCKKELVEFMHKYKNVYLKIVGYMTLDSDLQILNNQGRVIFKPMCPYQKLQYEIAEVDVNIAPLYDYYFNYGKSELKYFEAALVKVPSIVSNLGIYPEVVEDGVTGYLCDQGKWFSTLEKLYLDDKLRKNIAENAYNDVMKKYNMKIMKSKIESVYDTIIEK